MKFIKKYIKNKLHSILHIQSFGIRLDAVNAKLEAMERPWDSILNLSVKIAREDTAKYVTKMLPKAKALRSPIEVIDCAVAHVSENLKAGLYLEFGVWKGTSINQIASLTGETVYGFDSFVGLPETWRTGFEGGHFSLSKESLPNTRSNVVLVQGWFNETLPDFKKKVDGFIALLHVDCDLYSSTKTIFDELGDRITVGTIILFDEYFGYPSWEQHEFKAFQEFVNDRQVSYEYIAFNERHEQVAVKIVSILSK